jgi:lipopolysaccharide biosynthesis protein
MRQYGTLGQHVNARRYLLDHDALRFVSQVHQELPAQPPPGRNTLVLFAHFDPHGVVDPYVVHYLRALNRLGTTIVFVSGSPELTPESVAPLRSICAGIYTRRTLSLDFGSWHLAWSILRGHGWSLDQFDRLVLANDSVFGPLFPLEEMWGSFHGADMYGSIESHEIAPHLQSFFLAWDLNSRTRRFLDDFWDGFRYVVYKNVLIKKYELGLSARARRAGLRLKPFLSAATVARARELNPAHPWSHEFSGPPINNTLYYWDGLIEQFRYPFLKAAVPRQRWPQHDTLDHLREFVEQRTTYPYALLQHNLERLGCAAPESRRRSVEVDR